MTTEGMEKSRRPRFGELDGLRGIAALLVVGSHFTTGYDSKFPQEQPSSIDLSWGAYGVELFFLISGYVILMSARNVNRPSDFVISRVSRLYPVYWIALLQTIFVVHLVHLPQSRFPWWIVLGNFTMVQRLLQLPNMDEVYWTLTIEMQFYMLVLVLLVLTRCRLTTRVVLRVGVVWILSCLVLSIMCAPDTRDIDPQMVRTPVKILLNVALVQWGPWFVTGMLAYLARSHQGGRRTSLALCTVLAAAAALGVRIISRGTEEWYCLAVVLVVFLAVVARSRTRILLLRPVQWLGKVSYSLYIGHAVMGVAVIHVLVPFVGREWAATIALVAVLVNALVLHALGEQRGTRAARRLLVGMRARQRLTHGRPPVTETCRDAESSSGGESRCASHENS